MKDKQTQLYELVEETIKQQVESRVGDVVERNTELVTQINNLRTKVTDLEETNKSLRSLSNSSDVLLTLLDTFKARLSAVEPAFKSQFIYNLLGALFEKTFDENVCECPTWLGAVVNFYNNKDQVIELLKLLEVDVPNNINEFRLPHEWTVEELDIVFDTMNKHYVCNGCIYADNLHFWKPNALSSVYDVCYNSGSYTEIPWQFLLRNPNLLNEKYLTKIGKTAFETYKGHWSYFFKIQQYQELTPEQIKLIITNMNEYHTFNSKCFQNVTEFLMKNAEHFPDGPLLESFYECFKDSYDFKYNSLILKLPARYLEDCIKRMNNPFEWLDRNKNKFNEEQRKTLLKVVIENYLGGA